MNTRPVPISIRSKVGIVSTYPPTRCGIARFTASLAEALPGHDVEIEVARVIDGPCDPAPHPVTMEFDPLSAVGVRAAARHLDKSDVAIISHEFGIFGPNDGRAVVDLAGLLNVPAITVLHTVLPEPSPAQRDITRRLAELTTPVVLCRSARDLLVGSYGIPAEQVEVIHHGAHWSTQPPGEPPYRKLITWGLLGPGKGLERSLEAMALLADVDPPITYRIVGRTHPNVVRHAGHIYRYHLESMVQDLGLADRVEFVDRYVSDEELFSLVRDSDLVVAPYDNRDQVSSGVVTEAVGLGRPVVATRFPYAEEMLGGGAGFVVDHDPHSLAAGIRKLVEDPDAYLTACAASAGISDRVAWPNVALEYVRLVSELAPARATA